MGKKLTFSILVILLFSVQVFAKIPVYRDFAQVEKDLKVLAQTYTAITKLETYGSTTEGRKLYALKMATTSSVQKPKIVITAAIHGDELITTELVFILIEELLKGYGKDPRLTEMIKARDIYFIPVFSPDSFEARERNVQGVDPNRAFPLPDGPVTKSIDVVEAYKAFADKKRFTASLDLHAFGKLVMYPWSFTKKSVPSTDAQVFSELAVLMSKTNGYKTGPISKLIHEAEGSSGDYLYWKYGTVAMAAEIGREKIPHWSKFPALTDEVREMLWAFIEYF